MTRYDIARMSGYNSPEEYDEAQRRLHESFVESRKRQKPNVEKEPVKIQPISQWISIKDRLPDENQKCLVYRDIDADLKITTGIWYSDRKEFYGLRHGTLLEDTIAWMPLPEPPKDGDIK